MRASRAARQSFATDADSKAALEKHYQPSTRYIIWKSPQWISLENIVGVAASARLESNSGNAGHWPIRRRGPRSVTPRRWAARGARMRRILDAEHHFVIEICDRRR